MFGQEPAGDDAIEDVSAGFDAVLSAGVDAEANDGGPAPRFEAWRGTWVGLAKGRRPPLAGAITASGLHRLELG
jgi:hypothetical protein